jgi:hypothetical protein
VKRSEAFLVAGNDPYRIELRCSGEKDSFTHLDSLLVDQPVKRDIRDILLSQFWEPLRKRECPLYSGLPIVLLDLRVFQRVVWNTIQDMDGGEICIE